MPSPQQKQGAHAETTVERALQERGFPGAERERIKHPDKGDIGGLTDWTIEVKSIDPKRIPTHLSEIMNQVMRARVARGTPYAVAVVQRRNYGVGRWYAVMEFDLWAAVVRRLDELEDGT